MGDRVDDSGALSASSLSFPSLAVLCSSKNENRENENRDLAKIDLKGSEKVLI